MNTPIESAGGRRRIGDSYGCTWDRKPVIISGAQNAVFLAFRVLLSASGLDERQLGSAYGYNYGVGSDWDTEAGTYLYIVGPAGRSVYEFAIYSRVCPLFINSAGVIVGGGIATDDVYLFYPRYASASLEPYIGRANFAHLPCPGRP